MAEILKLNSNTVTVELESSADDSPSIGATLTVTLTDSAGVDVPNAIDLAMTDLGDGSYAVDLPATLNLTEKKYTLTVEGTDSSGAVIFTTVCVNAIERRSS